ncbi:MAG: RluA family pseudouridine synthase [Kangiellaceae bacterium]|nr:RluA family pseudouridine synthase [Kangiellaceae bacterium]
MSDSNISFEKHLVVKNDNQTIIDLLSENCPVISRQKIKKALLYGAVWLTPFSDCGPIKKTTRIRKAKKILSIGDVLHFYFDEGILFSDIRPASLVSDEGEYSVWNKPAGMFSQPSKWADHTSICRWVELFGPVLFQLPQRPSFLIHRLDRATNGLIIVGHNKKITRQLTLLFEQREIEKRYYALVSGKVELSAEQRTVRTLIDNKPAKSDILSIEYLPDSHQSRIEIRLLTGRKHQIRQQLSSLGVPIIGDRLYDSKPPHDNLVDLALQSYFLEFKCPLNKRLKRFELS